MRTDADDPARVRDPAIELLLGHTATLADGKHPGATQAMQSAPKRIRSSA
jgi:hypothetical protein